MWEIQQFDLQTVKFLTHKKSYGNGNTLALFQSGNDLLYALLLLVGGL